MFTRTFHPATFRSAPRLWDPFGEFRHLQEGMGRLADQSWANRVADYPPVNVWTNEEEIVVKAELPGLAPEEIEISVVQNTLTVRGSRKPEDLKQGESMHRRERWSGAFVRTIELPFEVDGDKVQAECHHGVLTVRLPRIAEHKPRKITIKAS
ncbi:MAG: Hsp20/alpha crystallin family protein [Candidatus Latescibacterota bacterium]|jgi:HSP20 family protein